MSKIALVAGARTGSGRLPNKVLYSLGGKPAFIQVIERITSVVEADYVVVACTEDAQDDPIELFAKQYGIDCFRGPESLQMRFRMAGDKLGLKDEDFFLFPTCDAVLSEYRHLPWMIEQMKKHDCGACYLSIPRDTLLDSFFPFLEVSLWKYERLRAMRVYTFGGHGYTLQAYQVGCPKTLILNFPPEYLVPFSMGFMALDHVPQAAVIKEVYRRLYKGSPIDIFDVRDLLEGDPSLASVIPHNLPRTSRTLHTADKIDRDIDAIVQSIRLNTDYVEVTWKGGSDVTPRSAKESKINLGGNECLDN